MAMAQASNILNGKTGYAVPGGSKITGSISNTLEGNYYRRYYNQNQTIPGGVYLVGDQVIRGVTTSNVYASNYAKGSSLTVKAGSSYLVDTTGTCTSDANASANCIMTGYKGYVNGNLITGTMTNADLNPYPVYDGSVTSSSQSRGVVGTVRAHPSSGNGSAASWSAGIQWNAAGGASATLDYTHDVAGRSYGTFTLENATYTCAYNNENGYESNLISINVYFRRNGAGAYIYFNYEEFL